MGAYVDALILCMLAPVIAWFHDMSDTYKRCTKCGAIPVKIIMGVFFSLPVRICPDCANDKFEVVVGEWSYDDDGIYCFTEDKVWTH